MKSYYEIVGDGGSRVLEQVAEQRAKITENLAHVKHLVAIGSGKGGVGKSTLTMQIARALQRRGASVAILDADLNGPTQARLAGLTDAPLLPGESGLALPRAAGGLGVVSTGLWVPESSPIEFETVAPGESQLWRATKEFTVLAELLAAVEWGSPDVLLVDLPPGAERTFQFAEFLEKRTAFVLVTVPSAVSRGVVSRSAAALERAGAEVVGLVENMSGYFCEDCGTIRPLFPEPGSGALTLPVLGRIPFDPVLAAASDRGENVEDADRPSLRAIDALTGTLLEILEGRR